MMKSSARFAWMFGTLSGTLLTAGCAVELEPDDEVTESVSEAVSLKATAFSPLKNVKATECGESSASRYHIMQGLAGAGAYVYIVFGVDEGYGYGDTYITKWRLSDGKCVAKRGNIDLGHGNDIAYHPNFEGRGPSLLIPKGTTRKPSKSIVVLDADDLHTFKTFNAPVNASAICYSSTKGAFAMRVSATQINVYKEIKDGKSYRSMDRSLKNKITVDQTDETNKALGPQGLDCSGSYIYDVRANAGKSGKTNYIFQFTWGGDYKKAITYGAGAALKPYNDDAREIEGVFHIGDQFYMGINRNAGGADDVYKISW